jgi:hypothetical protein
MALNSPASGEVNESTLGDCYRWAQKIGPYRSTTMMCAWSLPSTASAPKQLVMAAGHGSGLSEALSATSVKFAPQRRSLAEGNRCNAWRARATACSDSMERRGSSEPTAGKVSADDRRVMISVRHAGDKPRWIIRKE